jgi:uncharacterized protein (DUF302 family)
VIVKESSSAYAETAGRLVDGITRRGLTLFARIDHAAGARGAGLEMAPEEVFIFGSPVAGTPLMQRDPRVGYELPLRMLLWQEGERVQLGYRDPRELSGEYEISDQMAILDRMAGLLGDLAAEATAS